MKFRRKQRLRNRKKKIKNRRRKSPRKLLKKYVKIMTTQIRSKYPNRQNRSMIQIQKPAIPATARSPSSRLVKPVGTSTATKSSDSCRSQVLLQTTTLKRPEKIL